MTPEVLEHLFEPFFIPFVATVKGPGWDLVDHVSHRRDHEGAIAVHSDGPLRLAIRVRCRSPLQEQSESQHQSYKETAHRSSSAKTA